MSKKGEKNHLKRMNAPKVRKAPSKEDKWAVTTSPGPHKGVQSVPLSVALRDNLRLARTRKEAEKILSEGSISVDGKVRRNPNYPVGLMDIIKLNESGKSWRVSYDKKGYLLVYEIDEGESDFKLGKVVGKHPYKGGKLQISFHDGKTIIGDFEDVDIGDTLKVSFPELEVEEHVKCEEGNLALVTGGTNVGSVGKVEECLKIEGSSSDQFKISEGEEEFQSPEEYVFIIGKEDSMISLSEGD